MNKNIILLSLLFNPSLEEFYLQKVITKKTRLPSASNNFQINLIEGLYENNQKNVKIINSLPFGSYPNHFDSIYFKPEQWSYSGYECIDIPCINLPILKQIQKRNNLIKVLKEIVRDNDEIIIYSSYWPYLSAVCALKKHKSIKTTLLIPDLPEFFDYSKVNIIRKQLRKANNYFINKCMKRIDRFILLTKQMKEKIPIGDKPHIVIEGIAPQLSQYSMPSNKNNQNEIIYYSGSLSFCFGIKNLVDAFLALSHENLELWICGEGEATDYILEKTREDKRIHYFGYVTTERNNELRSKATLLINPRNTEGEFTKYSFPSKTMEYFSSGIPVIMYKLDGIPDEYTPYFFAIKGNTSSDIKNTIEKVLKINHNERELIAQKAFDFVRINKNPKTQAQKILDFISSQENIS